MAQAWQMVRLFISSTFRDMHAERDYLVRVVFPELKERCRKRHVQLIDVDLRWGVTAEQAEGGGALDICLDEIDSCRPFFLGLIGHRYGSVPSGEEHSITAQEIYHGVLHNYLPRQVVDLRPIVEGILEGRTLLKEQVGCLVRCYQWDADRGKYLLQDDIMPEDEEMLRSVFRDYSIYQRDRSFFFFRLESLTKKLAGSNIEDYFETGEAYKAKLIRLKQDIVDAGLAHLEYDDLEAFGQMVLDTLWDRIDAEFPKDRVEERDWLEEEAEFHELFMADRTRHFVGRDDLLTRMHSFLERESESRTLVITGEAGCGKSALMARFAEQAIHNHPDWLIIPHFVGASPSSTSLRRTLRRLCEQVCRSCNLEGEKQLLLSSIEGDDEKAQEARAAIVEEFSIPEECDKLTTTFHHFLQKASVSPFRSVLQMTEEKWEAAALRKVVIIIDAVNQFEKTDNPYSMRWLPHTLPQNVRVVVSTLSGEALDALSARPIRPFLENVSGLTEPEIHELVTKYFGEVRKEFPTKEINEAFYEKIKSGYPLYIMVALEELRVFPIYDKIPERVGELPDSVTELFDQVLERIEGDFSRELVRDFMSFIACGRQGMMAEELQTLLKGHAPVLDPANPLEKLPDMLFARLYRAFTISSYLFERSGIIDFFHGQLKEAVGRRYLQAESDRDEIHRIIADYFERRWSEPYLHALDELPHQMTKAKDWEGIERILCDFKFIEAKCGAGMTYDLIADYEVAIDALPEAQEERQKKLEHEERVRKYTEELISYACREITSLDIIPSVQPWTDEELKADTERIINHPTRLDHIRAYYQFVNSESYALVKFASHAGFCIQQAYNSANYGTIASTAEAIVSAGVDEVLLLRYLPQRPKYNPHPVLLRTLHGHKGTVNSVSITPDGKRAVSGSADETLRVWDIESGECLGTLEGHVASVFSVSVTPDGKRAVSGSADETLRVWDIESGECLGTLEGHVASVFGVSVTPDGERAVSGSSDDTLRVWDIESGERLGTMEVHKGTVNSVSITPNGKRAVSGSEDKTLRVWDMESGECLAILEGHKGTVKSVSVTPDGKRAVSGSEDKTLRVWDMESGECLGTLQGHTHWVNSVSITPDGKRAVSGSLDKTLRMWDMESGECLGTLEGHSDSVFSVSITPDGKRAVSGSEDKTLRVWDLESGECLGTMEGHVASVNSVSVTPDGKRAVSGSRDDTLRVWDIENGECLGMLQGHTHWVNSVSVTPDGKRAVSGSSDDTLRVWDLESGKCLRLIEGHIGMAKSVSMTPDGKKAVSGSADKTLWVRDLESGECIALYPTGGKILSISRIRASGHFTYGTRTGDVIILTPRNFLMEPPIVTPVRIWLYGKNGDSGQWEDKIKALCEWCGQRFPVSHEILGTIEDITRDVNLSPAQSPSLELPAEAWEELGLLLECPLCQQPLRFNPFVVDNRERPYEVESRERLIVSTEAKQHFSNAMEFHAQRQFNKAIEEYDEAIRIDTNYAQAYSGRGVSYSALGEHQRAVEDYDEAIRLDSDSAQFHDNRELALRKLAKHQQIDIDHDKSSATRRADTTGRRKNKTGWKLWKRGSIYSRSRVTLRVWFNLLVTDNR